MSGRKKTDYEKLFENFIFNLEHDKTFRESYYYILGLYLGDGHIDKLPRTFRLYIFCDIFQDKVRNDCIKALSYVFNNNKVGITKTKKKMIKIGVHSKLLPYIFPQIGSGKKYTRDVSLNDWQIKYVEWKQLLIGLFHSDGSIYKDGKYVRFTFSNVSIDITDITKICLDNMKIHYTTYLSKGRYLNQKDCIKVVVNDQNEMIKLYKIIGEKYEISRLNNGADIIPTNRNKY